MTPETADRTTLDHADQRGGPGPQKPPPPLGGGFGPDRGPVHTPDHDRSET